jgi:hypothetical protein
MDKPMSEGVDKTIVATEKPREREIKPDTRLQKEVPPTAPQPKSAATSPQAASAIENRKPKRSLEDLRKLARENRSQQPPQSGGNSRLSPRSRLKLAGFFPALIAVVVFGTLYQLYQRGTFSVPFSSSVDQENSAPTIDSPIPEEQPDAIAFPELSAGVYQGSISGFLGKNPIALSMVSMGAERGIIVFLGIPGWTPQIVQPEGGTESIRVASNGMIVDLKGTVEGTSIRGTMSNLVTGEQGTWQAERVQK